MKKLLFATAIAATAAAFGETFNAISFEGYTAGGSVVGHDIPDDANGSNAQYFAFEGTATDESKVRAFSDGADDQVAPPATRPIKYGADLATNANFLQISTEGGILWRSLMSFTPVEGEFNLGTAQSVGDGIYLDTMVQFTPTEDDPPTLGAEDKLAIWLGVVTNEVNGVIKTSTNLMVKAGYYDNSMNLDKEATFSLTGKIIDAGTWYRLTVTAIDDLVVQNSEYASSLKLPAFTIRIDGDLMSATTATMDATFAQSLANNAVITSDTATQLANGAVFVSRVYGEPGVGSTLQGVGFQGTGAIDDLVLTTDDPFASAAPTPVDFTLSGGANATVTYVYGETTGTWDGTATAIPVPQGTNITFTATPGQGFTYAGVDLTGTDWTLKGTAITATYSDVAAATSVVVPAAVQEVSYPSYIDTTDATIKGKYDTWKNTYGADSESAYETAFLLNMDPKASVAEGTALLKIASITEVEGGWQLEIVSEAATLAAVDGTTQVGNGYLRIIAAETLEGLASATPSYINVAVAEGKITVTVPSTNGKFMKAELTTQATVPAVPAGE